MPPLSTLLNTLSVLIVVVPILLAVAFMTLIERKVLSAMQRRVGPNTVGVYGILQPLSASGSDLALMPKAANTPRYRQVKSRLKDP